MPSAVVAVFVDECGHDTPRLALPRPEIHVAVRFGPSANRGIDVHVLGGRQRAHRKVIRAGQRTVMARLRLGTHEGVLGVPASALAGRIVALDDLWGVSAANALLDRLAEARDGRASAEVLRAAIDQRATFAAARDDERLVLAVDAASRLPNASVTTVAADLGVSERHLRRVFRDAVGMSPKEFAKVARFRRAVRSARVAGGGWATIAADAGYYDQAHLIADFRAVAGVTPRALLTELGARGDALTG